MGVICRTFCRTISLVRMPYYSPLHHLQTTELVESTPGTLKIAVDAIEGHRDSLQYPV